MKIYLLVFAIASLFAVTLHAQDSTKRLNAHEVIVTGFPSEEGKTPAPITKISRAEIHAEGELADIPSLLRATPNLVFYSQNGLDFGYSFANIRGFDQRRQSILVNGIPQNDPEDHNVYWVDIPDIGNSAASITVQRGAGSAFYGPPAIGGSVNVVTAPSPVRELIVSANYGSFKTSKLGVSINSGLVDEKYIFSARLTQLKSDGYRNHNFIDQKSYYLSAARFDEKFNFQINLYGGSVNDGLDYYGIYPDWMDANRSQFTDRERRKENLSESFIYERRPQEQEFFFQPHYEFLSSWMLDKSTTFSNSLFYIQGDGQFDFDGTWVGGSQAEYFGFTPVYGERFGFTGTNDSIFGNSIIRAYVGNKQFGWLPRIEYQHPDGTLTLGGEFRIHRSLHWGQLLSAANFPEGIPDNYHYYEYKGGKDILSGYVAESFNASDALTLAGSVQFLSQKYRFFDQKEFYIDSAKASASGLRPGFISYDFSIPLFFINPRLGFTYKAAENASIFGSVSYTAREARLKDYYNGETISEPRFARTEFATYDFTRPNIRPEKLLDIELSGSYKAILSNDADLDLSIGGYYMPFTDELVKTNKVDRFGESMYGNAESVEHYGIEFATAFNVKEKFRLSANVNWSHNEITEFTDHEAPETVIGKQPIGFPSIVAGMAAVYSIGGLSVSTTGRYVGEMFGDMENSDFYRNEAYVVLDAAASFRQKDLLGFSFVEVSVRMSNVLDALYTSYVTSSGFFVGATRAVFGGIQIGL